MNPSSFSRRRWRFRIVTRRALWRLGIGFVLLSLALVWGGLILLRMPGQSYRGPLPAPTDVQVDLARELHDHVDMLAGEIGPRNVLHPAAYARAEAYLEGQLASMGYDVERQTFEVDGHRCSNLIVEIRGSTQPEEIIIVGAHYDTAGLTPGADDNASAVAALLALAQRHVGVAPQRTLRFVCFANEEPPYFQQEGMGSLEYARRCRQREETVVAMVCLEMLGCYSDEPSSQRYPLPGLGWIYPKTGDFIAFVGNVRSRRLVREVVGAFRARASFPSEGAALPGWIPGISLSDHWSFWRQNYPAVMVTDTAMFRYPYYHSRLDQPHQLDYDRMARVVDGLAGVLGDLASREPQP